MPGTPHPASGSPLRRGRLATATPTAKRKQNVKSKSQSLPNPKEQKKTTGTAGATATFLGTLRRGTAGKQGASTPRKKKDIFANAMSRAKGLNFSRSFALTGKDQKTLAAASTKQRAAPTSFSPRLSRQSGGGWFRTNTGATRSKK